MPDFASLFSTYSKEAFRLEMLPEYNVSGEWENFQHYLQTGVVLPNTDFQEYLEKVRTKVRDGAKHTRLRVVEQPLIPYQIFEIKMGYIPISQVGGFISLIERNVFVEVAQNWQNLGDFWLFDDRIAAKMQYDGEGKWLGADVISDVDEVNLLREVKTVLLQYATPMSDFLRKVSFD